MRDVRCSAHGEEVSDGSRNVKEPVSTGDRIVLTFPAASELSEVATLVLGGLGSRLELPYEHVDDLQLAALSVLAAAAGEVITMEVALDDHRLAVTLGPLAPGTASDEGLRQVLLRLVDRVEAPTADGGAAESITLIRALAGTSVA
jgi:hypothetical protein